MCHLPSRLPRRAHPVVAALFLAACHGEPTGPGAITVSLALTGAPTESIAEVAGDIRISCDVTFRATVGGRGTVAWKDGVVRFYLGADRTSVINSVPISSAEMQQLWAPTTPAGSSVQSELRFDASVPFEAELELHYVGDNGVGPGSAMTRFACGPKPPAGGTAPPTIGQVTITPSSGELEPGQALSVTYSATSPFALWSTKVRITGPYVVEKVTAERSATATTRTVQFTIPRGVDLGVPIGVNVIAVDPALQAAAKYVQTPVVVVDRTPPVISSASLMNGSCCGRLAGRFAVGDVMSLFVASSDNNAVRWLVWELGAPANFRDSVAAPAGAYVQNWSQSIVVRPEWVGSPVLSIYVRDAAGLKSAVLTSMTDSISFYPLVAPPTVTSDIATSSQSHVVDLGESVYDAKRNQFYVALQGSKEIAVLDVATMTFKTPLSLTAAAAGLDLSPGGDSLIVSLAGTASIAVVDLARPTSPATAIRLSVLDTAGLEYSNWPAEADRLQVARNGKAFVTLTGATKARDRAVEIDLRTGAQRIRSDARSTSPYHYAALGKTPDGGSILFFDLDCSRRYTAATDTFGPCAGGFSATQSGVTFDAAGQRFTLANSVFEGSFTRIRSADAINGQMPVAAVTPDGQYLYLGANKTVTKMRISDGAFIDRFNLPIVARRLYVSPGGDWLMVFQGDFAVRGARVSLK